MKELQPYHVLLYVVGIFAILFPLSFMVKDDKLDLGGLEMRFLSWDNVLVPVKPAEKKDISNIVKVDTLLTAPKVDSLKKNNFQTDGKLGAPDGGQLSADAATQMEYNDYGLQALHRLFEKLEAASGGKKVRILHYGDSQIEGDRMTSYIRQRLQSQFGGNGPGTIPAMNVYNTLTFKQRYSDNFKRYTAFGGAKLRSKRYGSMCSAARFTPEYDSSELAGVTSIKEAFIEIEPSNSAYERAKKYNNVYLYYTSCVKPCKVKVFKGTELIHEDSLIMDGRYHAMKLSFESTPSKLRYEFSAAVSPTIIGFSLEGDYGVQVDNIGMRGSSGTFFGKIDHTTASKMYAEQNVEMVIMQFGGNSVPYLKDSSAVRNFAKNFKGQLYTLKKLRPTATVIVIGPSDMSTSSVNGMVSYRMLPYLVTEMKRVTKETGSCYWDLFAAMGGENSMPSWVEQGLAGKDYIHFTNKGASIASQLFFDAFAAEYVRWKGGTK